MDAAYDLNEKFLPCEAEINKNTEETLQECATYG